MIQQTSFDSFNEVQETLLAQNVAVFKQYLHSSHPLCDRDIAEAIGIPCSQVSARRNDLMKNDQFKFTYTRMKHPLTNRTVMYWRLER